MKILKLGFECNTSNPSCTRGTQSVLSPGRMIFVMWYEHLLVSLHYSWHTLGWKFIFLLHLFGMLAHQTECLSKMTPRLFLVTPLLPLVFFPSIPDCVSFSLQTQFASSPSGMREGDPVFLSIFVQWALLRCSLASLRLLCLLDNFSVFGCKFLFTPSAVISFTNHPSYSFA